MPLHTQHNSVGIKLHSLNKIEVLPFYMSTVASFKSIPYYSWWLCLNSSLFDGLFELFLCLIQVQRSIAFTTYCWEAVYWHLTVWIVSLVLLTPRHHYSLNAICLITWCQNEFWHYLDMTFQTRLHLVTGLWVALLNRQT